MSKNSRTQYLESIRNRYSSSKKIQKNSILDEFCKVCGYNRKYAIRLLNIKPTKVFKKKLLSTKKYEGEEFKGFLVKTWKASNLPCGKRLKPIIGIWLPKYLESGEKLSGPTIKLLGEVSAATIDRIFKPFRHRFKKRGLCTTKPGSRLKDLVPIRTNQWDESRPGFVEADTIAHCGNSIAGMFVYSVNMVDISSGWSIQRAIWGKGETGVLEALKKMESILPFKIRGFDCDNGGEFLNWGMLRYFKNRKLPVAYTRARAYHKNDNAHVEGKNWTLIRQYLGYERFDKPEIVRLLNDLYSNDWYYLVNFFLPSSKLINKERVGSKIIKKYDKPKTPFERLIESKEISKEIKEELKLQFKKSNPYQLEKEIQKQIHKIFTMLKL